MFGDCSPAAPRMSTISAFATDELMSCSMANCFERADSSPVVELFTMAALIAWKKTDLLFHFTGEIACRGERKRLA